jgi:hypothetical protein
MSTPLGKLGVAVGIMMLVTGARSCQPGQREQPQGQSLPLSLKPPTCDVGDYRLVDKQCSACGRSVSMSSRAGQRCPHCRAYWSGEKKVYTVNPVATPTDVTRAAGGRPRQTGGAVPRS